MNPPVLFDVERQLHRPGEAFRSRDFADAANANAHLRWWHNRALHNAWGVASGFASRATGSVNGLTVVVEPGLAYDCFGRELIETARRRVAVPDSDRHITLLARTADPRLSRCAAPAPSYAPSSGSRRHIELFWRMSRGLRPADGVPIAEIITVPAAPLASLPANFEFPETLGQKVHYDSERKLLLAVQRLVDPDRSELRRMASTGDFRRAVETLLAGRVRAQMQREGGRKVFRSLAKPTIGRGSTIPGGTVWTPIVGTSWQYELIETRVDTSAAGFTGTPCYFAWLQGLLWDATTERFLLTFVHLDELSAGGFTFRILAPVRARALKPLAETVADRRLFVCWIGVQHSGENFEIGAGHGHS